MKAQQLNTIILSLADPVALQAALDLLRAGKGLTAGQSGTVAYPGNPDGTGPFANNVELGPNPVVFFDGFQYTVFLFYIQG